MRKRFAGLLLTLGIIALSVVGLIYDSTPASADAVDLYWVGGSGYWSETAHWSTSTGGAGGHAVPTSTNAVYFDGNSSGTVTLSSTWIQYCESIDFTGSGANSLVLGNASGSNSAKLYVYGSFTYDNGVTFTDWNYNDTINMLATGTITSDGGNLIATGTSYKDGPLWIINASGGTVSLADDTTIGQFSWSAGTFDTNGHTLSVGTHFGGNGQTYGNIELNGAGATINRTFNLDGANTFTNLTLTSNSTTDTIQLSADQVVTGTLTLDGINADTRLLVISNSLVTQRTITAATVSSAYVDFGMIIGAGAGDWDLSAAGEDAIDFSGNSGITFAYPYSTTRDYYWKGGEGTWHDWAHRYISGGSWSWSTTSGGSGGAKRLPPPASTNDVYMDSNSGFTIGNNDIHMSDDLYMKDFDMTGSDIVVAPEISNGGGGSSTDQFHFYGDVTLVAGLTGFNHDGFQLRGTGTLTTNGALFNAGMDGITVNCTGTYTLQDDIYFEDINSYFFTYTSGTLDTNGKTIHASMSSSVSYFNGGGQTYYGLDLTMTNGGFFFVNGENTFTNLTAVSGNENILNRISFGADQYIANLDLEGYSSAYRLLVGSTVAGVQRQLSVSTDVYIIWCDISDIAGVGAASWDISWGFNSDLGGNLGIIFTTPLYIYWVGNGGTWTDATNHWASESGGSPGTGRIPLIQDIAVFDEYSFTLPGRVLNIDYNNISGIDATSCLFTPTFSKAGSVYIYGNVSLGTVNWSVTSTYFTGTDTGLSSSTALTTNMYVLKNPNFMSTLFLGSNVQVNGTVYLRSGILNLNGWDLTSYIFDTTTTTYDRAFRMGSGTYELNGTAAGVKWGVVTTKFTLYCETSTLKFTNSGTNGQTWDSEGLTYNNVIQSGTGVWTLTVSGTPTVFELRIDRSEASKTITGSVTITLQSFILAVAGTNTITITNTDFSMATGVVFGDYLIISGSAAGGGATYFANVGGNSTNNGGNTGWIWTAPTAPTAQTQAATDVTEAGATLNGAILTAGSYIYFTCYFEYGPTIGYGWESANPDILTAAGDFDARLTPYHAYHYRAVIEFGLNDHAYGNDMVVSIVGGLKQAQAAVGDPGALPGDILVTEAPAAIPNMYAEGNTGGIPFAPLIDPALVEADLPVEVFWFPVAFLLALVAGFGAYGVTKNLIVQAVVSGMIMAGFAGGGVLGTGLIPYMTVVIFALEAVMIIIIQEKQHV